ncbi:MAG: glycoside hydrolase family 3 N-terminal domain-containing protein [Dehalococcoidia bacterium]|nr:glycoside hydrolase family 3 N-terminal domain-containing protein [Dehalococcoidia bacterium]
MRPLLLAILLSLAALFGGHSAEADATRQDAPELAEKLARSLGPREKIEQLFIAGVQGPELNDEARRFIAEHKIGGVYLARETCNVVNGTRHDPAHCGFPEESDPDTPAQVAALTQQLQQASCDATRGEIDGVPYCLPMFITIDHEGDDRPATRLINRFTPIPSNMAVGATFDPAQAEAIGCIVGQELAAVGVNMLFGPDLDVLDSPRSGGPGDQGIRVFGGDARWVGEMGEAYVRGIQRCGEGKLAAIAKHFPGHGRSTRWVDYEDIPVVVGKNLQVLAQVDLLPFAVVSGGEPGEEGIADGIMNSHLSYPEVPGCEAGIPVTFSPACMQTFFALAPFSEWRESGGITVADDLASGAVQSYAQEKYGTFRQADIALEALMAGNDLLPVIRPWQWSDLKATVDYLVSRYEGDEKVKARVDDAVLRVLRLKERLYGSLDPTSVTASLWYEDEVGRSESALQVNSLVEKALTFIKPATLDEALANVPAPTAAEQVLFVECWDDASCSTPTAEEGYPPLWPRGTLARLATEMFPGRVSEERLGTISFSELGSVLTGSADGEVRRMVEEADWLVFAFLERDPSRYPASDVLKDFLGRGSSLFDLRSKKTVVFAYNSPYHLDAGELRNVTLFVAAYSKIEPSLRASLKLLFHDPTIFHDGGAGGRLPVDYIYGDYVLHDLSEMVKADPAQSLETAVEPPQPTAGHEFQVSLRKPLLAVNGHRVPDGTQVIFALEPADGAVQSVAAKTDDGLAAARMTISDAGPAKLSIRSEGLLWTREEPVEVLAEGLPTEQPSEGGGVGATLIAIASLAGAVSVAGAFTLVLRRRRRAAQPVFAGPAPAAESAPVAIPELNLDTVNQRVFVSGKEMSPPLSREQYAFLEYLYQNVGKLCLRDDIINHVWPEVHAAGVSDEALDALVHRVRERLRAAGASNVLIVTVRGRGFRLDL